MKKRAVRPAIPRFSDSSTTLDSGGLWGLVSSSLIPSVTCVSCYVMHGARRRHIQYVFQIVVATRKLPLSPCGCSIRQGLPEPAADQEPEIIPGRGLT